MKITDYQSVTELGDNDRLVIETPEGTKSVTYADLKSNILADLFKQVLISETEFQNLAVKDDNTMYLRYKEG